MKIAIFGAGAIGAFLGARLCEAGHCVSLIARGAHLKAMQANGVTLKSESDTITVRPFCTDRPEDVGVQDYVFVTLKAHGFPQAAEKVARLMGPDSIVITAMNGIPYWYFHGLDSPWRDRVIESVDPQGVLTRTLPPRQVIGSVLYPWAEIVAPSIVEQSTSSKFILGEPDGRMSDRVLTLAAIMGRAKLEALVTADIRSEIWIKLWGNLSFNPLTALTGATVDRFTDEPALRDIARTMMVEAERVAAKLGVRFLMSVDERIAITAAAGARKTSMLQDLERGRSLELAPLLGAVIELGEMVKEPLPLCRTILALTRERERNRPGQGASGWT